MYVNFFKRIIDILLSFIGLIALSPIFLIVSILLLFANGGKAFFFQKRPGKHGKIFEIIKFKSMNDRKDAIGNLLSNEERLTPVGSFIRKLSLDEIPQLLNVLKGEMSLVGPRPLKVEYLELYSDFQKQRHNVKPGITGWAQVNGRNAISYTNKFKLDVYYVNNISLLLDIKILFLTVIKVVKRDGIDKTGANINTPFNGKN